MPANNCIARFGKVSCDQFLEDCRNAGLWVDGHEETFKQCWRDIRMPVRATSGSAGYDFFMPFEFLDLYSDRSAVIPTGIRCVMDPGWCLMLMPRSSCGFKYGMRLANTVGLIDGDYAHADNEGHIMVKLSADHYAGFRKGDRFVQGIFLPYGLTIDDEADKERDGGLGSTGK